VAALVVVLAAVAVVVGMSVMGTAAAQVTSCADDVTTSGLHEINTTITNSTASSCIDITASDVVLEGNDNTVDGVDGDSFSTGVDVSSSSPLTNVTVRNLTVTNWGDGVWYSEANNGEITDVSASGNANNGLVVFSSSGNTVMSNDASGNGAFGIALFSSSDNDFTGNTAQNNVEDFRVENSSNVAVEDLNIGASTAPDTTLSFVGTNVTLNGTDSPSPDPDDNDSIGRYFDADNTAPDGELANLELEYDESDLGGADESTLTLLNFDGTQWQPVPGSSVDEQNNVLTADITDFSTFGGFAQAQPTNFDVEIVDTTSPINAGENLDVAAEITNNGNETETRNITLTTSEVGVSGTKVRDLRPLTLNAGESRELLLSWNTTASDDGDYIVEVGVPSGGDTTSVMVGPAQTDPKFEADITGTTAPVQAGEELSVVANVENVGDDAGNATVELFANSSVRDNRTVNLDGGDDRSISLVWDTTEKDAGDRTIEVRTEKDSDTETVGIQDPPAPAEFEIGIDSTTSPTQAGDRLGVVADVENVGDTTENETVRLLVDGDEVDNRTKEVRGGEDRPFGLFWDTDETDTGDRTIEVVGSDDSASTAVTVEEPPTNATFDVEIVETTAPVGAGETLEVEARVENIGDKGNVGEVSLRATGAERDNRTIDLAGAGEPGSVDTVVLRWETTPGDEGERIVKVTTNRSLSDAERVTVEEPPTPAKFEPEIEFTTSPVQERDKLAVQANIENVGDENGTQEVSLEVGGSERDNETIALEGGEDSSVVLVWETTTGDAGDYLAEVRTGGEVATTVVTVEEPPEGAMFDVRVDGTTAPVRAGETLEVVAEVKNIGETTGGDTVELFANGTSQDSETVSSVDPGDDRSVVLEWGTTESDAGETFVGARTSNASAVKKVLVEEPPSSAEFDVSIARTNSPVRAGETLEVEAAVENTGETTDTKTVNLSVSGTERDSTDLELAPGETKSVVLTWETDEGDGGDPDRIARASTPDDTSTETVSVGEAPDSKFGVEITGTTSPVQAGETLAVEVLVENTGEATGNGTVELSANGSVQDSRTSTLGSGDTRSIVLEWPTTRGDAGETVVEARISNDSTTEQVTVDAPPTDADFDVSITGTTEPTRAGETLGVEAAVENTGETEGTATVELIADGSVRDTDNVTVDGRETSTTALEWETTESDEGTFLVEVDTNTTTDRETREVTIGPPPTDAAFEITIDGTTAPIQAGETLEVDATVENIGETADNGTVELVANGTVQDTAAVDLSAAGQPGSTDTVALEWATMEGDAGDRIVEVDASDEGKGLAVTETVTVEEPPTDAEFELDIVGTTEPTQAGDTLGVDVLVENTGETEGTETLELLVNGTTRDTDTVPLGGGDSSTVALEWKTTESDEGTFLVEANGTGDRTTREVTIGPPPTDAKFELDIVGTTEPTQAGETLGVEVAVENTGETEGTETVELLVNGTTRDTDEVTLGGGDSSTLALEWETAEDEAGGVLVEANGTGDRTTREVTVGPPPMDAAFEIGIESATSPVQAGETLEVDATVENIGETADNGTIELVANGKVQDTGTVNLSAADDPGDTDTVTFEWTTTEDDAGDRIVQVDTADEGKGLADTRIVRIEEPPTDGNLEVAITDTTSPIRAGETLEVEATVENTGDTAGTDTVSLNVSGEQRDTATVDLDSGESNEVVLEWNTTEDDAGETIARVSTSDDTATKPVTVGSPPAEANFEVEIDDTTETDAGETFAVQATVENTGEVSGTTTPSLSIGDTNRDTETVGLEPGDSRTVVLRWETTTGDAGDYVAEAETSDSTAATPITIGPPPTEPTFEVNITGTTAPVTGGDELAVEAVVENVGSLAGTGTVSLEANGDGEDSETVDLDPGERRSVVLLWDTTSDDVGEAILKASTSDDTATTNVEVGDLPEDAKFDVSISRTTSSVRAGDTVEAEVTVENIGETPGRVNVDLLADGERQDDETIPLEPGDSRPVVLRWTTEKTDVGEFLVTAEGPKRGDTTVVEVEETTAEEFDLEVNTVNNPVEEKEVLEIGATVENTGETEGTQTVSFEVADKVRDTETITLEPDDSRPVVLRWTPLEGDAGEYIAKIETLDDGTTEIIEVERGNEPPIASFNAVPEDVVAREPFSFVSRSIDLDGSIERLEWDFGDGTMATGPRPTHTYDVAGLYIVNLTVTDDDGATSTTSRQVIAGQGLALESPIEEVPDGLWTVVTGQDGERDELSLADVGDAIQEYQEDPEDAEIDGVEVTLSDLGDLIQYYRSEVA